MIQNIIKVIKNKSLNHRFYELLEGLFGKRRSNSAQIKMVLSIISLIGILSCLLSASGGTTSDLLAGGVEDGLNSWIIGVCDSVYAIGTDDTNLSNVDPISQGIFRIATFTYNPFGNSGVQDIAEWSVTVWGVGVLIYLMFGLFTVIVSRKSDDISKGIAYITKINTEHTLKQYTRNSLIGIVAPILFWVLCGITLMLNHVLTSMVMVSVLPAVAPSPDNIIIYVLTAGLYFVMLLFFAYRFLYINLFVGFGLLIVLLYIFSIQTRRIAIFLVAGFIIVTFMQFVVVAITACGVLSIQAALDIGIIPYGMVMLFYCGLLLILVIVGFVMTVGTWFLRKLLFAGTTALKVVV